MRDLTAESKMVVAFDLDHTISRRDTFKPFLLRLVRATPARLAYLPHLAWSWSQHQFGQTSNEDMKNTFLARLAAGMSRAELNAIAEQHVRRLLSDGLFAEAIEALEQHRARGAHLLLATASPDIYVEPLATALGFHSVIASRLAWHDDDTFAGHLDGNNCYAQEKARRVQGWLDAHPSMTLQRVYTDHISDLPFLAMAREGVAVNADVRLQSASAGLALRFVRWQAAGMMAPATAASRAAAG